MKKGEVWTRDETDSILLGNKADNEHWWVAAVAAGPKTVIRRNNEGYEWFYTLLEEDFIRNNYKKYWGSCESR